MSQKFQKEKILSVISAIVVVIPSLILLLTFQEGIEKVIDKDFELKIYWSIVASFIMVLATTMTKKKPQKKSIEDVSNISNQSWISYQLKDMLGGEQYHLPTFTNQVETSEAYKNFIHFGYFQLFYSISQLSLIHYHEREKIDIALGFISLILLSTEFFPLLKTVLYLLLDGIPEKVCETEHKNIQKLKTQHPKLNNNAKFTLVQPNANLIIIKVDLVHGRFDDEEQKSIENALMNSFVLMGIDRHVFINHVASL